jgi:hypothetical protein
MLLENDVWFFEITSKLSGVILRKALMENSFEKVYKKVFQQIIDNVYEDDVHILEILGDVGG